MTHPMSSEAVAIWNQLRRLLDHSVGGWLTPNAPWNKMLACGLHPLPLVNTTNDDTSPGRADNAMQHGIEGTATGLSL